jgi:hypothetical protein
MPEHAGSDQGVIVIRDMSGIEAPASSSAEIRYRCVCGLHEWFAEEARRTYGDVIPSSQPGRQTHVY